MCLAYPCGMPSGCQCFPHLDLVQCYNKGLTQVPQFSTSELTWIQILDIRGNQIQHLETLKQLSIMIPHMQVWAKDTGLDCQDVHRMLFLLIVDLPCNGTAGLKHNTMTTPDPQHFENAFENASLFTKPQEMNELFEDNMSTNHMETSSVYIYIYIYIYIYMLVWL